VTALQATLQCAASALAFMTKTIAVSNGVFGSGSAHSVTAWSIQAHALLSLALSLVRIIANTIYSIPAAIASALRTQQTAAVGPGHLGRLANQSMHMRPSLETKPALHWELGHVRSSFSYRQAASSLADCLYLSL